MFTALTGGFYCVVITETLSIGSLLNFQWLLIAWGIPLLFLLPYILKNKLFAHCKEITGKLYSLIRRTWIMPLTLLVLMISFCLAVIYPPNNYDSLTYHMARVAHWMQNQQISHYQTHILRQLVSPPLAEWMILHLQILTKGDILANALQLLFFAGCISNVSLITKELGGSYRQQLLSILFTCLIPMAIIQSNTTQNDIVVGFFISSFAYLTIRGIKHFSVRIVILSGIALGLAWLTKGTAYIYSVAFLGWYLLFLLKDFRSPSKSTLKKAFLVAVIPCIAISINYGHFYRNKFLTGSYLGKANEGMANEGMEIKSLTLVFVKNLMNHMPVTSADKQLLTEKATSWGIDVNDPAYSYNRIAYMMENFSYHEDYAQNFVHTTLIILIGLAFLLKKRLYSEPVSYYTLFTFTIYTTAILFCILLKWQPWSNRLQTPLFMLFCVTLSMEIGKVRKWLQVLLYLPMLYFGYYALLWSKMHPVLPIEESIFKQSYNSFMFKQGVQECGNYLDSTNRKKIGIIIAPDSRDYPFYKLLSNGKKGPRILNHIFVQNASSVYPDNFIPDAIISYDNTKERYELAGNTYYRTRYFTDGPLLFELK
jgi:4-amino-4-deoxy-L-arabinose transferase-like glycosyltransferase